MQTDQAPQAGDIPHASRTEHRSSRAPRHHHEPSPSQHSPSEWSALPQQGATQPVAGQQHGVPPRAPRPQRSWRPQPTATQDGPEAPHAYSHTDNREPTGFGSGSTSGVQGRNQGGTSRPDSLGTALAATQRALSDLRPPSRSEDSSVRPRSLSDQNSVPLPPFGAPEAIASLQHSAPPFVPSAALLASARVRPPRSQRAPRDRQPTQGHANRDPASTGGVVEVYTREEGGHEHDPLRPVGTQPKKRKPRVRKPTGAAAAAGNGSAAAISYNADESSAHEAHRDAADQEQLCVVCTNTIHEVAVGACNHQSVCGRCCLRLRLCFANNRCSLCNMELKEVVIGRWRPKGLPEFAEYEQKRATLWQKPSWARGVLVDSWQLPGTHGPPLHIQLQQMIGRACSVCDPSGSRPFPSDKELLTHVVSSHKRRLCGICIQEHQTFPLELQAWTPAELQSHMEAHPACQFCEQRGAAGRAQRFYGGDELFHHMQREHQSCHVCLRRRGNFNYFRNSQDLVQHLRLEHQLCEDPECEGCFTAFESAEELDQHRRERHSGHMPRWNSRAGSRQMQLGAPDRRDGSMGGVGSQDSRSRRSLPSSAASRGSGRGMTMIDDDLGMMGPDAFPDISAGTGGGSQRSLPSASEYAARVAAQRAAREAAAFPALGGGRPSGGGGAGSRGGAQADDEQGLRFLQAAAPDEAASRLPAVHMQRPQLTEAELAARLYFPDEFQDEAPPPSHPSGSNGHLPAPQRTSRPAMPALVRQTAACPCGRRTSTVVLAEGQTAQPLQCTPDCERQARRARLADAFGISQTESYIPVQDRTRAVSSYPPDLLLAAKNIAGIIAQLERAFAEFLADSEAKRMTLPAMPRSQRAVAHSLAEQYGLTTHSLKSEPARCVEVFKSQKSALPSRLLSEMAAGVSEAEILQMEAAVVGFPIRIISIESGVSVASFFRQWAGDFTVESAAGSDEAIVRFSKEVSRQEALTSLGGGIRGKFRIDHRGSITGRTGSTVQSDGRPVEASVSTVGSDRSSARVVAAQTPDGWQTVSRRPVQGSGDVAPSSQRRFQDAW